jgi:hypothetical protein
MTCSLSDCYVASGAWGEGVRVSADQPGVDADVLRDREMAKPQPTTPREFRCSECGARCTRLTSVGAFEALAGLVGAIVNVDFDAVLELVECACTLLAPVFEVCDGLRVVRASSVCVESSAKGGDWWASTRVGSRLGPPHTPRSEWWVVSLLVVRYEFRVDFN